jgi:hypothetical protein
MRRSGTAWHSGVVAERALSSARRMYGPGYRVTYVREKPDVALGSGVLVLVRWEVEDQDAVDEEYRRSTAPLTGLQRQALAYLAD